MVNKLTKYSIIAIITLTELIYLSYALFDKANILIPIAIVISLTLLIFPSEKSKVYTISYIAITFITLIVLGIYYSESIVDYLETFWIRFINGETQNSNALILSVLSYVNFHINFVVDKLLKTYYVQLVKTVGLIVFIWLSYKQQGIVLTWMITTLIIFIFLEAVTSLFSKLVSAENGINQILRISRYILIISIIITGLTITTKDPLGFLDELDFFEDDNYRPARQRMDAQGQITNQSSAFTYSDDTMLIVQTPYQTKLRGNAFDFYSNTNWKTSTVLKDELADYQQEFLNRVDLLNQYNVPYEEYQLNVVHKVYSKVMYSTANSYIDVPESISSNKSSFYESENELGIDTEYTVNAINIDYKAVEFRNLITSLNVDRTNEQYLQLPETFNEDIRTLTIEITKNAESVYDKVIAVEQYLAGNHVYTRTPIQKPNYFDYIDFFLFESQEGFCTHYASSMVIMLRSIDIPARYIVGYVVVSPEFDDRYYLEPEFDGVDEDLDESDITEYYVDKDHSHAWVEVKFEDYGWLEFEPTSSYYSSMAIDATKSIDEIEPIIIEDITDLDEPVSTEPLFSLYYLLVLPILTGIYFINTRIRLTTEEKIIKVWKRIKRRTYKQYKLTPKNETVRELMQRAKINNDISSEIINIYENTCYSKGEISLTDLIRLKELHKLI